MVVELRVRHVDLNKTASAAEIICSALRDAIIRGDIPEGQNLRQDAIARLFNVSRVPVREALQRLEAQGLAASRRYKGMVVNALSPVEIEEIFDFRALVEPKLIELSVKSISDQSLALAKRYCDAFSTESNAARWGDLNRLFHFALYRDCGKEYYLSVIAQANDRVERYIRAQLALTEGMERARRDHQAILDACMRRDAAAAGEHTRDHIRHAAETLLAFLNDRVSSDG